MAYTYDFETLVYRGNVGSGKWNMMLAKYPDLDKDIVPLSVADMEFKNAPEIVEGLKECLDSTILGYASATDAYFDAVISWMTRRHGFTPKREWILQTPGVIPGLSLLTSALTEKTDSVLILTPAYPPFRMVAGMEGRTIVESALRINGNTYDIDFADFEEKAARPDVKLFIFCSPHNPIGRVWTEEEVRKVCEICLKHNVFVISDEIHFDLIMPGYEHVSMATMDEKYLANCAVCTAPSKTFNLAGMQAANIIIPDDEKRDLVRKTQGHSSLNILGYKACELAYNRAEAWLDALLPVIDENRRYVEEFMCENLPQIKVFRMQGTYLLWLDFRALGLDHLELEKFMQEKAKLFLDEGYIFGENGQGYERINLACPKKVIVAAMDRLLKAVQELGK